MHARHMDHVVVCPVWTKVGGWLLIRVRRFALIGLHQMQPFDRSGKYKRSELNIAKDCITS